MAKANTWTYTTAQGLKAAAIYLPYFITFFVFADTNSVWPKEGAIKLQLPRPSGRGQRTTNTGLTKNADAQDIKGFYGIKEALLNF